MNLPINLIDIAAIGFVLLGIVLGARSGFIVQAAALAGFAVGVLLLIAAAPHLATLIEDIEAPLRGLLALGAMAGIVLLGQSVGSSVGLALRGRMGRGIVSGVDRGAGAVFGLARGIVLVWLMGGLLAVLPVPSLAAEARQSLVLRVLDTRLPSPVILAAEFGRIIGAVGLPDVFVGVVPAPPPRVDGPAQQEADQIAEAARASTVRVEATACGRFLTGTGFAVEPAHFVTNAHVLAGADRVWVSFDGALDRHEGVVVHFDPHLDAALVYVSGLDIAPLSLAAEAPDRGGAAAALGFTGGGRQRVVPASVSRTLEALGRDIYGGGPVARQVIELHADVAPGDSGGPVILPDGSVGGVTFSESRVDRAVGYALTPDAVAGSIDDARSSTRSVSPGACLP